MGSYLFTGINTKIETANSSWGNDIPLDEVVTKLGNNGIDLSIYDYIANEKNHTFVLKDEILKNEFYNFLKKLYDDIYMNDSYQQNSIETILSNIKEKSLQEIYQYEKKAEEDIFQKMDCYETIEKLDISFTNIAIVGEGKILMETYGTQFDFYQKALHKAYKEFRLGSTLRIFFY
jgi:hypothetical protein